MYKEIKRYFTAKEVLAYTGITYRQLNYWVCEGIIRASGRSVVRRGYPRLFTFRDIVEIRVVKKLTSHGLKLSALKKCLRSIRKRLPKLEAPLASERLITNGHTLFRYLSDTDTLESLDEFGQFAFSFGLGEEIKAAINDVNKLPKPTRYCKKLVKKRLKAKN